MWTVAARTADEMSKGQVHRTMPEDRVISESHDRKLRLNQKQRRKPGEWVVRKAKEKRAII